MFWNKFLKSIFLLFTLRLLRIVIAVLRIVVLQHHLVIGLLNFARLLLEPYGDVSILPGILFTKERVL